jgi:hypothetical protein
MQRKWEKRAACSFWTLRLTVPNSPITYNLSNFIIGCRSLGDKIIEVLLYQVSTTLSWWVLNHILISFPCTIHKELWEIFWRIWRQHYKIKFSFIKGKHFEQLNEGAFYFFCNAIFFLYPYMIHGEYTPNITRKKLRNFFFKSLYVKFNTFISRHSTNKHSSTPPRWELILGMSCFECITKHLYNFPT